MIEDTIKAAMAEKNKAFAKVMSVTAVMVAQAPNAKVGWEQHEDRATGGLRLRFDVSFTQADLDQIACTPANPTHAAQAASKKVIP